MKTLISICTLLFLSYGAYSQLKKVASEADYDKINLVLEQQHSRRDDIDDRKIIKNLGYDPMSYLEFGFTHASSDSNTEPTIPTVQMNKHRTNGDSLHN